MLFNITKEELLDLMTYKTQEIGWLAKMLAQFGDEPPNTPVLTSPHGLYDNIIDFPMEYVVGTHIAESPQTNLDNLTSQFAETPYFNNDKEKEEYMRINKNISWRATDSRWIWSQQINGQRFWKYHKSKTELYKIVREFKKSILNKKPAKPKVKCSRKLIDLCRAYYTRHIKSKNKNHQWYLGVINNHMMPLTLPIEQYTKDDIVDFLAKVKYPKASQLAFWFLRWVFRDELDKGNIKRDITLNIETPTYKQEKGKWYNPQEQKTIYENRNLTGIGNEIEFILMVGCRLGEAFNCVPHWDKNMIYVNRTKRDGTSGYVDISPRYAQRLKEIWPTMFKQKRNVYSDAMTELLDHINVPKQKNNRPIHRLRHTFATNTYYLGVDDKKRSYLLGHTSTSITNDIYTDFDPTVKKADIIGIYGDLYPEF